MTRDGRIYIDPEIAGADTPIHEYTHLWARALRQSDMKAWLRVVEMMKKEKALWEQVSRDYPELTDENEIADEVLAHYSGTRGERRLMEKARQAYGDNDAKAASAVRAVRNALTKFWNKVAKMLGLRFTTANRVADMVLDDLVSGKNPADDHFDPLATPVKNVTSVTNDKNVTPAIARPKTSTGPSSLRRTIRDKVVSIMRRAGMEVYDDGIGRRMLAYENERVARLSKTKKQHLKPQYRETSLLSKPQSFQMLMVQR